MPRSSPARETRCALGDSRKEPGGLSWYETLTLLRRVIERRTVVGCDIVELSPIPGNVAPNFLCAKLIYKILTYRFRSEVQGKR